MEHNLEILYYFFFIYFCHPPKFRAYPFSQKKVRNFSLPPPPHARVQLLIHHQQNAALLDSVVFFNARVKSPVQALCPLRAFSIPHTNPTQTTNQPTGTTPTVPPLPVELQQAYFIPTLTESQCLPAV